MNNPNHQGISDRALDLELTQGDTAALMQSANELLEWVESNLNQDVLHERPPGELDRLLHNSEGIKAIRESFESRRRTLQRLHEIATSSKGTLSEANLKKIEQLMTKLDNAWEKMEESLTVTTMSTEDVLSKMEAFNTSYNEQDEWERDAKQTLDECLPIEADLDRLNEQQDILESLNSEILDHKRRPEELTLHADAILQLSQEGTGKELQDKVFRLQERFSSLEDAAAENSELCEDAKGDVQKYNELEKEFNELIVSLRESFDVLKAKPKKPVGNVQETIDSHMDYCIEVEGKSCTFTVMYDCGLRIRRKYPPSQKFAEALSKQLEEWEEFVSTVVGRWSHYVHIKELWKNFEATVKDFLEWLMAEGKSFSKDVTTLGGVKGVSDHMKTCEALKNTLKAKDKLLDDISSQAEELQDEDGEKANGTKDVDSRLNDVSIHWNSVCQLLSETLQTLDAVYKKLVLINEITLSEQEWITALGALLADKQTTHGVVELVKNEVELFKGYLDQFEEHRPSYQVIVNTESFVLEHTSCLQHDDIKKGVSEFVQEFDALEESAKDYVARLEQSIPLWEMFNKQKEYLSNWVTESQALYDGDALRPGNALVTRNSLNNAEILFEDIQSHFENVQVLNELMTQLSDLCVEGDKDFITDHTNSLSAHIDDLKEGTEGRKDLLETRMESWKAFPVQAAVDVQEFLEAVSKEVGEEEEDFDDCSTAELMEKLERLELLQSQQSRKRGSISTLDSSVSNKEVQKALEKNPDISQERNSLLKGWSSSSSQLTSNLHMLRLKAEMATKLEKKTKDCTAALDTYHQHLTAPLPHSVSLHKCQFQWKEKEVALGNDCDKVVNDLLDTHKDFKSNKKVEVPKRLNVMVNAIRSRHTTLKEKAVELTDHITQRVRDWEQFKDTMASLSDWLEGALIELTHLSDYYLYLSCFEDILDRHKLVQNQMKTKAKGYLFLQQNHRYHLVVQQKVSPPSPSIVENEEEGEEGGVSEEIGQNNPEGEEREGDEAPAVTEDPDFLHYQSQWADIDKGWGQLETSLDNFLTNKGPWEKMADVYCELDGWRDEIKGRIDTTTSRGEEIYRLGRNPGPITEAYRQFQSEINSRQPILTELHSLIEQQLPEQLRSKHLAVREFIVCCDQLQEDWTQLNTRTQELARDSVDKMEEWENRASDCMKRVPLLQHEINDKSEHIRTLEQQIGDLRKNPPYKLPPRRNCICRLLQYLILVFVPFALLSIVIILNLNEGNLFRLFRLFEKLFPFFEITASNNSFY